MKSGLHKASQIEQHIGPLPQRFGSSGCCDLEKEGQEQHKNVSHSKGCRSEFSSFVDRRWERLLAGGSFEHLLEATAAFHEDSRLIVCQAAERLPLTETGQDLLWPREVCSMSGHMSFRQGKLLDLAHRIF